MSGHVGDLSPKQSAALDKLKEKVSDITDQLEDNDDYYFLRWLRARNFDVEKSEKMMRDHLASWRTWRMDELLDWDPPPVLQKYLPGRFHGATREGHPVLWERPGRLDLKGLVNSSTQDDMVRCQVQLGLQMFGLFKSQTEKLGRRIDTCVTIYDMEGFSMNKLFVRKGIKVAIEMTKVFEENFPEILEIVYIINISNVWDIAYNIIKPFMSETTRRKVVAISGPPEVCHERLRELIEPSILPACYGGTFVPEDGDVSCDSMLVGFGTVPRSMYFSANMPISDDNETLTIARRSSAQIEVAITKRNCKLGWGFATEQYDIAFSILYKPAEQAGVRLHAGQMEEVVPSRRVDSHENFEEGSTICAKTGVYVLRFDNTYSWTKAKVVHYQTRVEEDVDNQEEAELGAAASTSTEAATP